MEQLLSYFENHSDPIGMLPLGRSLVSGAAGAMAEAPLTESPGVAGVAAAALRGTSSAPVTSRLEQLFRHLFGILDTDGDAMLDPVVVQRLSQRLAVMHRAEVPMLPTTPPGDSLCGGRPPGPLLDYAAFRSRLLQHVRLYDSKAEEQEASVVRLVVLEQQLADAEDFARTSPPSPSVRRPKDPCDFTLEACACEAAGAPQASRPLTSLKSSMQHVVVTVWPHLKSLADTARWTSSRAATGGMSSMGILLDRAREKLELKDHLAGHEGRRWRAEAAGCPEQWDSGATRGRDPVPARAEASEAVLPQPPGSLLGQRRPRSTLDSTDGGHSVLEPPCSGQQDGAWSGHPEVPELVAPWLHGNPTRAGRTPGECSGGECSGGDGRPPERTSTTSAQRTKVLEKSGLWRYEPGDRLHIDIRSIPDVNGPRTGSSFQPGEVFRVCEELRGADGVLYLRLEDSLGWVFDQKPGIGVMCVRADRPAPITCAEEPAQVPTSAVQGAAGSSKQCFWPLSSPSLPSANSQPLLQLAHHLAAQARADPSFGHAGPIRWPQQSTAHVGSALRLGGE